MTNKGWSIQLSPGSMTPCNCVGQQRGEPYCPCVMRARGVFRRNGRWIEPERDLGPDHELGKERT